jgi:hypothetical protein
MKLTRLLMAGAVAAALSLAPIVALAGGQFPGFPNSTSPGTVSTNGATSGGAAIPTAGCVPMDTGASSGLPQTLCVSPNQLATYGARGGALWPVLKVTSIPIGSVAYGSLGTNTTPVAGTIYYTQINLPAMTVTNIGCMNGGTAATDKLIYGLYNSSGTLVANTALTGVVASGTDAFQEIALAAAYTAAAGEYFVAWQTNGTTTRFRTIATATYIDMIAGSQTGGTFGTLGSITSVATGITADKGPICYVN